jgi:chromosome segregation ATPase
MRSEALIEKTRTELKETKNLAATQASKLAARTTELKAVQTNLSTATATSERLQAELTQTKRAQEVETTQLRNELKQVQENLSQSQAENIEKETTLSSLRTQIEENRKELESLEGDYSQLDQKYQKLLKPSRSSKGKKVVEVMYTSAGYSIRKPGDSNYQRAFTRDTLAKYDYYYQEDKSVPAAEAEEE